MQAFNRAERQIQKLRREKRALVEAGANPERVKAVEKRITTIMSNMNKMMAKVEA